MAKNTTMFPDPYNAPSYDAFKPHETVGLSDWGPSMTRQEFSEDCDINVIMKRFEVTGQLPVNTNGLEATYVDYSLMPEDYTTAMNMMIDAEKAFMTLPARVRKEFDNDPVAFVEFASDRNNIDQMRSWGLAPPPAPVLAVREPAGSLPGSGALPAPDPKPPQEAPKAS